MRLNSVLAISAVLFLPTRVAAQTADSTRLPAELVVRTFDRAGISPAELERAREEADGILKTAGIQATWLHCWDVDKEPAGASPRCRLPLSGNEVTLRIQPSNAAAGKSLVSMGFSLVNARNGAANLSTVYTDQVDSVARRAGVDSTVLLGRAIAHELGHLLLDTNRHANAGLMREIWSQSELRRDRPGDWAFQQDEARAIRAAVGTRMASGN